MIKTVLSMVFLLAAGASVSLAQNAGDFGAGLLIGSPIGGTAKILLNDGQALAGGVGYSRRLTLYGDYLWHSWKTRSQPYYDELPIYLGLGLQVRTVSPNEFGLRTVVGMAYWLPYNPVEIFIEAVPVISLSAGNSMDIGGGVGLRYYFSGGVIRSPHVLDIGTVQPPGPPPVSGGGEVRH